MLQANNSVEFVVTIVDKEAVSYRRYCSCYIIRLETQLLPVIKAI